MMAANLIGNREYILWLIDLGGAGKAPLPRSLNTSWLVA
jgi:hypothetical protein